MRTTTNGHHVRIVSPCNEPEDMKQLQQQQEQAVSLFEDDTTHVEACEVVPADSWFSEPIIEHIETAEVLTTHVSEDESLSHLPLVSAILAQDDEQHGIHHPSILSLTSHEQQHTVEPDAYLHSGSRPEFIYASTLLLNDDEETCILEQIGLTFQSRAQGGALIASLSPDSPFQGSYVRPGDHIVAINSIACADASLEKIQELILRSSPPTYNHHNDNKKEVTICVHNSVGAPSLVSSSIMKPNVAAKVGITLRRRNDVIHVKGLAEDSLFGGALLLPKQRCVAVNGVPSDHLSAHLASDLIGAAACRVTIVSEIQSNSAVTIARYGEHVGFWRKVAMSAGLAGGGGSASKLDSL